VFAVPGANRLPVGTVYVPSACGLMRNTLPRRSFVLPDERCASNCGLRLVRSSIGV
jgi:hypothetical protein